MWFVFGCGHVCIYVHNLFYLFQVKLICTANGSPGELFLQPNNEVGGASSDEQRALMDDLGIDLVSSY